MRYLETAIARLTLLNRLELEATVNVIDRHFNKAATSAHITQRAEALSARLRAVGERAFPPTAQKSLRSFTSGEVAEIVGVSDGYLRQLSLDGLGPSPDIGTGGRRSHTLEQINGLRQYLAEARPKEAARFWPRRKEGRVLRKDISYDIHG